MKFSTRAERIEPFYVMEVAKAAQALAREVAGTREPMIFLNIGEPDFTAPPLVQEAATRAGRGGAAGRSDSERRGAAIRSPAAHAARGLAGRCAVARAGR